MKSHSHKKIYSYCLLALTSLLFLVQTGCDCSKPEDLPMLGELPDSPILLDTVSLPECSDDETIVNTTTSKDGKPVVYSYTKASSSITIHTYLYSGDGSYQEIKQAWLKNIPFDSSCRPIVSLNYRRDGSAELLVREIRRNHNQVTVYATKDGTSRDIISFKTSVQKKSYCPQNV